MPRLAKCKADEFLIAIQMQGNVLLLEVHDIRTKQLDVTHLYTLCIKNLAFMKAAMASVARIVSPKHAKSTQTA